MKKQLLTLAALGILCQVNAQSIREIMKGQNGLTAHFTALEQTQQVRFDPAQARTTFALDPQSDLVIKNTEADQIGMLHYRYYQTYNGIPVENSMYIVHTKNGMLTGMSGSIVTDFDPALASRAIAKLTTSQVVNAALGFVNARQYAWQVPDMEQRIKMRTGDVNASYYPKPSQVWYNAGDDIDAHALRLAFKVDVYTVKPFNRQFIYVDALTGKVLGTQAEMEASDATGTAATAYSGTQTIHSDNTGTSFRLRDDVKGNGVITLHATGGHADYTNSTANWALTGADQFALDAHYGVEATWTYYKNNFNRNSIDNAGFALVSWVNDPNNTDNADWDGSEMDYGKRSTNGNGVTAIDVTGHELTHGVTQFTSNLVYANESGAMNESMSDCAGKSVQFYTKPSDVNWQLSNDMSWIIRDMSNPNLEGQPDTYKGTFWQNGGGDNGGVHTNSGVGNFAFYLLVHGGSGTNDIGNAYTVSGIGLTETDQILYRTETVYLTPNSKYADWRTAYISSATDLFGATSNEVVQSENAWFAVGIGTAGGGGGTYCASSGSTTKEFINNFTLEGINNTSGNNGGYHDYTSLSTSLSAGAANHTVTVTPGFTGTKKFGEFWTIYIDYNHDGSFTGTGEKVLQLHSTNTGAAVSKSFKVPLTALNGATRMRVQMHFGSASLDPCATLDRGEVEDYTVNITGGSFASFALQSKALTTTPDLMIAPNPVADAVSNAIYHLANNGSVTMRVVDMYGRVLQNVNLGNQSAGEHTYVISQLNLLAAGNYLLLLVEDNQLVARSRFIVSK
jgi:bacillolysin